VDAVISCRSPCRPEPAAQCAIRHYGRWADEAALGERYQQNRDPAFRARCLIIKGQRSELVASQLLEKIDEISKIFWEPSSANTLAVDGQRGLEGALRDGGQPGEC
jgi:hypothetical protein